MNDRSRMLVDAIRGPIILITVGVLFAADRMTDYHFHQTWPVLLIVIGLLQLVRGRRRPDNYFAAPPNTPPPNVPPPYSGQTGATPRSDTAEPGA
jgi:hypothetical protein